MEIQGVVQNGVIVPDDAGALLDGTRVRITPIVGDSASSFGDRYAQFKGKATGLPPDVAAQHEHYRLGIPKR